MKKYLIYYPVFWVGYCFFKLTGKTNWYAYVSFRRLFVMTKGKSNDEMSERMTKAHPPTETHNVAGVLGNLGKGDIEKIVNDVKKNGFHIFDTKLSEEKIQSLIDFSLKAQTELIPPAENGTKKSLYDRSNIMAPRYQFNEQELLRNKLVQEINFDASLFAIAQAYLNCNPIQDLTAMWWSAAFKKDASSEAAQLYHFDMDRFKFIKFFFYLTDVDTANGPHCYVRGSHAYMPDNLWKDGRIQDAEVASGYKKEDILEIIGVKGSIIAVDTRGLHKGKVLEKGERLILQVEFTNSLFGATYEKIDLASEALSQTKACIKQNPYSFQRFSVN